MGPQAAACGAGWPEREKSCSGRLELRRFAFRPVRAACLTVPAASIGKTIPFVIPAGGFRPSKSRFQCPSAALGERLLRECFPSPPTSDFFDGLPRSASIITTSKLVVCTAPYRGHYRHSPCKGYRIIVSHHTHCHPYTGKAHSFHLSFSFNRLRSSICFPSESLMRKLFFFPR